MRKTIGEMSLGVEINNLVWGMLKLKCGWSSQWHSGLRTQPVHCYGACSGRKKKKKKKKCLLHIQVKKAVCVVDTRGTGLRVVSMQVFPAMKLEEVSEGGCGCERTKAQALGRSGNSGA